MIPPFSHKNIHGLISGIWIYSLSWQWGINVVDGIKVTNQLILRWDDESVLSRQVQNNHKGPDKWKREAGEKEPDKWMHENNSARCCWGFEDGGMWP